MAKKGTQHRLDGETEGLSQKIRDLEERELTLRDRLDLSRQELDREREVLESLMEYIPEGITVAEGPDLRIRLMSRYGRELSGLKEDPLAGIPLSQLDDVRKILRSDGATSVKGEELPLARAVLRGEVVKNEEWILERPDGSRVPVLCNAGPICDREGKITGGVNAWRDIRPLKEAQEALLRARDEMEGCIEARTRDLVRLNELFERVFSSVTVLIAYLDRDFRFLRVNRAFAEAEGRDPEFFEGKSYFGLYPAGEDEIIFRKVVETKQPFRAYEMPLWDPVHPEKGMTYWDWNLQPVTLPDGRVEGLVLTRVDRTERRLAKEALIESERRFRAIFDQTFQFIGLLRPDGTLLEANQTVLDFEGLRREEMIGRPLWEGRWWRLSPATSDRLKEAVRDAGQGKFVRYEADVLGNRGETLTIDFSLKPVRDLGGEVVLLIAEGRDISALRRIQERTDATNRLLRLFVETASRKEFLDAVVQFLRLWSGCRCAGVRVIDEQGLVPYEAYEGFDEPFWRSENRLSLKEDQCICLRTALRRPATRDLPYLTKAGSFHCNDTPLFLKGLPGEARSDYRGVCITSGFASVAVVPVPRHERICGLIHLADERKGRISSETIEFIEQLAPIIGEAIHKFNLEEELQRNHDLQIRINHLLSLSLEALPLEELLSRALDQILSMPWLGLEEKGCLFLKDREGSLQTMIAQRGLCEEVAKAFGRTPAGACLCREAARSGAIQFISCPERCPERTCEHYAPHGHYCVPLVSGSGTLGMMNLYVREGEGRSERREAVFRMVAGVLASLVERKRAESALQESERELRHLSSRLLTVQEKERKRVAQELHDSIGQTLTAIKFGIEGALHQGSGQMDPAVKRSLEALIATVQSGIEEARKIMMDLRPSILDDLGILATLRWFCREFEKIYTGIRVSREIRINERDVPEPLKIVIYRVIQEAFHNASKHSGADRLVLSLARKNGRLRLSVRDNGRGFDPKRKGDGPASAGGVGLGSMKERVEVSGGIFAVESGRGAGTTLTASWPAVPEDRGTEP
jgi:PAS domain S-box-containing protein